MRNKRICRRRRGIGGPKKCICPNCGYEEEHKRGERCINKICPKCKHHLIGKW